MDYWIIYVLAVCVVWINAMEGTSGWSRHDLMGEYLPYDATHDARATDEAEGSGQPVFFDTTLPPHPHPTTDPHLPRAHDSHGTDSAANHSTHLPTTSGHRDGHPGHSVSPETHAPADLHIPTQLTVTNHSQVAGGPDSHLSRLVITAEHRDGPTDHSVSPHIADIHIAASQHTSTVSTVRNQPNVTRGPETHPVHLPTTASHPGGHAGGPPVNRTDAAVHTLASTHSAGIASSHVTGRPETESTHLPNTLGPQEGSQGMDHVFQDLENTDLYGDVTHPNGRKVTRFPVGFFPDATHQGTFEGTFSGRVTVPMDGRTTVHEDNTMTESSTAATRGVVMVATTVSDFRGSLLSGRTDSHRRLPGVQRIAPTNSSIISAATARSSRHLEGTSAPDAETEDYSNEEILTEEVTEATTTDTTITSAVTTVETTVASMSHETTVSTVSNASFGTNVTAVPVADTTVTDHSETSEVAVTSVTPSEMVQTDVVTNSTAGPSTVQIGQLTVLPTNDTVNHTESVGGSSEIPPTPLVTVAACRGVVCGAYQQCYNFTDGWRCECDGGFIRDPQEAGERRTRGCVCPASKIFENGRCLHAKKVMESTLTLHGIYNEDFLNMSSQLAQQVAKDLKEEMELLLSHALTTTLSITVHRFTLPPHRRKRAADPFTIVPVFSHIFLKLRSLYSVSEEEMQSTLRNVTARAPALPSGYTFTEQSVPMRNYDYCEEKEHNCDLSTTTCHFRPAEGRLECDCFKYHSPLGGYACAFNVTAASEGEAAVQRENDKLRITVYVFVGAVGILACALCAVLLLLRMRPKKAKPPPPRPPHSRFSQNELGQYKARLPRPVMSLFNSNTPIVTDTDHGVHMDPETDLFSYHYGRTDSMRLLLARLPPPPPAMLAEPPLPTSPMPPISTFSRRQPPSTLTSVYSSSPSEEADTYRSSLGMEMHDYASPTPYSSGVKSPGRWEGTRPPIQAFDGPTYRSAEGMIFSMEDRPAVHQAVQMHRNSALMKGG